MTITLEEEIQKELKIVAEPFLNKINFLEKRIQVASDPHKGSLIELLSKVRRESFVACYDHFKNKIDARIETPCIDGNDEDRLS
jgi:hypothetical protein